MAHWKKRQTVFAEYGLGLTMQGAWQLRPSNDPYRWLYRSADHREHLTLSMGEAESVRNEREREAALHRAVGRHLRAVELGFARVPGLEIAETTYGEHGGVSAAWYHGAAGASHRFHSLLLHTNDAVWALFYEAFRLTETDAADHAQAIFDSVALN